MVIGISDEPIEKLKRLKRPTIDYYSATDTQIKTKSIYGKMAIPYCESINPDGIMVWDAHPGLKGYNLTSNVIKNSINEYKKV